MEKYIKASIMEAEYQRTAFRSMRWSLNEPILEGNGIPLLPLSSEGLYLSICCCIQAFHFEKEAFFFLLLTVLETPGINTLDPPWYLS